MRTNSTEYIQNNKKVENVYEAVEKYFPGFLAFTDCTEQQLIPRPVDNRRRKLYYSGKKKRHTVKNQLMVNSNVNDMLYLL